MFTYATEYHKRFGLIEVPLGMSSRMEANYTHPCSASSQDECLRLMRDLRETFRIHWTRMDIYRMTLGLHLTLNALLAFMSLDNNLREAGLHCALATLVGIVLALFQFTLLAFLPFIFVSYRLLALWIKPQFQLPDFGAAISGLVLLIAVLVSCSNSFVVQEARVLSFLLQTLLMATCICTVSGWTKMLRSPSHASYSSCFLFKTARQVKTLDAVAWPPHPMRCPPLVWPILRSLSRGVSSHLDMCHIGRGNK